ncbi:MAG: hypothetical protein KJ922_03400, partial [Nanoarchaeota archaeon]|nr:hypothetical protein [Nanoarchaeota archaeon]
PPPPGSTPAPPGSGAAGLTFIGGPTTGFVPGNPASFSFTANRGANFNPNPAAHQIRIQNATNAPAIITIPPNGTIVPAGNTLTANMVVPNSWRNGDVLTFTYNLN